jgi:hypothetical protein
MDDVGFGDHGDGGRLRCCVLRASACFLRISFPPNRGFDFYLNFFPPNRGVDFYFEFLPAKLLSDFYFIVLLKNERAQSETEKTMEQDNCGY